jgi:hypothetical protein
MNGEMKKKPAATPVVVFHALPAPAANLTRSAEFAAHGMFNSVK